MGTKNRVLILVSVFMLCLLTSSVATVVADDYWGNLAEDDEIVWKLTGTFDDEEFDETITWEILDLDNDAQSITVKITGTYKGWTITSDSVTYTGAESIPNGPGPFIWPASDLHDRRGVSTETYNWKGTDYKTGYVKASRTDDGVTTEVEWWLDYDTGITFEINWLVTGGETETDGSMKLDSTTADLTEGTGGSCLGTVLIALVSVTTFVTYGLVRYQKKDH